MSGFLLETRRNDSLVEGAKEIWLLLSSRAPGTSKATNLARKYHGVHIETEWNPGSDTYLWDIGQPLDPSLDQECRPTPGLGCF